MKFHRLLRAADGAVAVETAMVTSLVLVPMLLGLWDVAQLAWGKAKLDEALQDAVTYVASTVATSGTIDNNKITTAAQAAYGTAIDPTSTPPTQVCYCVQTNTGSPTAPTTVSCSGSCGGGTQLQKFLSITVKMTVTMPFSVPYLGASVNMSSNGVVRTG